MSMSADGLYIGLDGGGTSTTVIALNHAKQVLCTVSSGSTNFNSVGKPKAKEALLEGIKQAVKQANNGTNNEVRSICLGVSGCNTSADAEMLVGWVSELFDESNSQSISQTAKPVITSYNDSYAALASGTLGELHGIILIAGTGQMVKGLNKHRANQANQSGNQVSEWTAGGNGGLIDNGCGFSIGVDVARAAFSAADEMGPSTPMLESVLNMLRTVKQTTGQPDADITVEALVPWLYNEFSWGHVATLAPIAFEHAASDPVAYSIIEKHAEYLIRAARTIIRKLEYDPAERITCVLAGGILAQPLMKELVSKAIQEALPNADITEPKVDPAHGAALLAWTQANKH